MFEEEEESSMSPESPMSSASSVSSASSPELSGHLEASLGAHQSLHRPIQIQNGAQKVVNAAFYHANYESSVGMEALAQQMNHLNFDPNHGHSNVAHQMQTGFPSDKLFFGAHTNSSAGMSVNGSSAFCASDSSREPVYATMASHLVHSTPSENGLAMEETRAHGQFSHPMNGCIHSRPDLLPRCTFQWM